MLSDGPACSVLLVLMADLLHALMGFSAATVFESGIKADAVRVLPKQQGPTKSMPEVRLAECTPAQPDSGNVKAA